MLRVTAEGRGIARRRRLNDKKLLRLQVLGNITTQTPLLRMQKNKIRGKTMTDLIIIILQVFGTGISGAGIAFLLLMLCLDLGLMII